GASARGCRCEARRQSRSDTRDPKRGAAHHVAVVEESAGTVRSSPTTDLEAARRPCSPPLPCRRGSGAEVLLHALRLRRSYCMKVTSQMRSPTWITPTL